MKSQRKSSCKSCLKTWETSWQKMSKYSILKESLVITLITTFLSKNKAMSMYKLTTTQTSTMLQLTLSWRESQLKSRIRSQRSSQSKFMRIPSRRLKSSSRRLLKRRLNSKLKKKVSLKSLCQMRLSYLPRRSQFTQFCKIVEYPKMMIKQLSWLHKRMLKLQLNKNNNKIRVTSKVR